MDKIDRFEHACDAYQGCLYVQALPAHVMTLVLYKQ